jgi:hypothetical protein
LLVAWIADASRHQSPMTGVDTLGRSSENDVSLD